jgi:hypothetical protein
VFKGKWVYEVQMISNKLSQVGWCQMLTPFTNREGVGDDKTSYAYDGYRITLWHDGPKSYGDLWDTGDIIGCAIDLDNKHIEFFRNGKSMGVGIKDIPAGENIAYFPGISSSADERVAFNFGKSPLSYNYNGYEPIDIPDGMYNGSVEITAQSIDLLRSFLLKLLIDKEITLFYKLSLSNKIFSFLASVSFKDIFVFKTLLVPFLFELTERSDYMNIFMEYLYIYIDESEKGEFTNLIFENICNCIEENGIKGASNISEWKNLIKLLTAILKIDFIVQLWIDSGKYIEHLRCIFNTNLIHNIDIYNYINENYNNFNANVTAYKVLKELKQNYQKKIEEENEKYEDTYSQNLKSILQLFLEDSRTFKNYQKKEIRLKSLVADFINNGFEFGHPNDFQNLFALNYAKKDYCYFYKNFMMNLFDQFSENFDKDLSTFSPEPWFCRMSNDSIYYDEVGIGGTISHVTSEYINTIDIEYRQKGVEFLYSELNHRIIKLSYAILIPALRDFNNIIDKVIS